MPAIASLLPGLTPPVQPLAPIATGEGLPDFASLFGNAAGGGGKTLPGLEEPVTPGKHPARDVLVTRPDLHGEPEAAVASADAAPPTGDTALDSVLAPEAAAPACAPIVFTPILGMTWIVPQAAVRTVASETVAAERADPLPGLDRVAVNTLPGSSPIDARSIHPEATPTTVQSETGPERSPGTADPVAIAPNAMPAAHRTDALTARPAVAARSSTSASVARHQTDEAASSRLADSSQFTVPNHGTTGVLVTDPVPTGLAGTAAPVLAPPPGLPPVPAAWTEQAASPTPLVAHTSADRVGAPRAVTAPASPTEAPEIAAPRSRAIDEPSPIASRRPQPVGMTAVLHSAGAPATTIPSVMPETSGATNRTSIPLAAPQTRAPVLPAAPAPREGAPPPRIAAASPVVARSDAPLARTASPGTTVAPQSVPTRFTAAAGAPAPISAPEPVTARAVPSADAPAGPQPAPVPPPARAADAKAPAEHPAPASSAQPLAPSLAPDTAALLGARPAAASRTAVAAPAVVPSADRVDTPAPTPLTAPVAAPEPLRADTPQPPLDLTLHTWPTQMVDRIERLRDAADAVSTSIRLLPDALGVIDVSVRKEGEVTHVHLAADQPKTRALLAEAQPKLAELAEQRGLRLGQAEIGGGSASTTGGQQQPAAQQHAGARQPATPVRVARTEAGAPDDSRIA